MTGFQPLDLHLRVTARAGGGSQGAQAPADAPRRFIFELAAEGAQPGAEPSQRHAEVMKGFGVCRIIEPHARQSRSFEKFERHETRAVIDRKIEPVDRYGHAVSTCRARAIATA